MTSSNEAPAGDIAVRVYRGTTQAEAAFSFERDARDAAASGYEVLSQAWEGPVLTVTYRRRATGLAGRPAVAAPPSEGMNIGAVGLIIAGVMAAIGSVLPWATVSNGFATISVSGVDRGGDGSITLVGGVLIALLGLRAATSRGSVAPALAALLSLGVGIVGYIDLNNVEDRLETIDVAIGSAGVGLYVVIIAGVVGFLSALAAARH